MSTALLLCFTVYIGYARMELFRRAFFVPTGQVWFTTGGRLQHLKACSWERLVIGFFLCAWRIQVQRTLYEWNVASWFQSSLKLIFFACLAMPVFFFAEAMLWIITILCRWKTCRLWLAVCICQLHIMRSWQSYHIFYSQSPSDNNYKIISNL